MYCIKENYIPRLDNDYDPEIIITDDYQNEVYKDALELANKLESSILDIGTGRAFKLLKYFSNRNTLGLDLPPTVEWLKENYPDRKWATIPFDEEAPIGYDIIICADVIEHVQDPDALCNFIKRCNPRFAIISTPDRDLLKYRGCDDGPPYNTCHVREWSFSEFEKYMQQHFDILRHYYPNKAQVCQGVIVKMK